MTSHEIKLIICLHFQCEKPAAIYQKEMVVAFLVENECILV